MKWIWTCTCSKCGREIADGEESALEFKRAGWTFDTVSRKWTCDECAEKEGKCCPGTDLSGSAPLR